MVLTTRKQYTWTVPLMQPETGRTKVVKVKAYWSPDHDTTSPGIGVTAAAIETYKTKQQWVQSGTAELEAE